MTAFDPLRTLTATRIAFSMDGPWFRKFGGFGYIPIRWEGVGVLVAMAAVCIPCLSISLNYMDRQPILAWGAAIVGVAAAGVGHAVVVWKMERNYGRNVGHTDSPAKGCILLFGIFMIALVVVTILTNVTR